MSTQVKADLDRARRIVSLRAELAKRRIIKERIFIESCSIEDKKLGALVPFKLWPAQVELLPMLSEERLLILKARQLGLTWLDLAHWLYEGTFWGNRLFIISRQTLEDAKDAIHRLKVMHDSLPEKWQASAVTDNELSLGLGNGSRFRALPSTARIAHGVAAYGGLLDEFALYDDQSATLDGADPACQRLHIITTGRGGGDLTETIWDAAGRGEGRWQRVFLPWTAHPERDATWYRENVEQAPEPRRARRQYAATSEDAFSSPEGVYFERFDSLRNTSEELEPVRSLVTYRSVDFGYRHPACLWAQRAPSGQLLIIDELLPDGTRDPLTTPEFADAILEREAAWELYEPPVATYCDPAGKAANVQTAESEFEVFEEKGLRPYGEPSSVRDGCVRVMTVLADEALPLVVSRRCPGLIRALSQVRPHRSRTECYDFDHVIHSHPLDALRYLLIHVSPGEGGLGGVISGMHGSRLGGF